jgi:alpha-galactosidase
MPEAADWALDNMSRAIREFQVDWVKIDSNQWDYCDDAAHGHGATDGDWGQIQGVYHILNGLRQRFPDIIIENCAGGSQRADFGMARYCRPIQVHDRCSPSFLERQYAHGAGAMYPQFCPLLAVGGRAPDAATLQWRLLARMMGSFNCDLPLPEMPQDQLDLLGRAVAFYKRFRPTLHGDRYVLAGPVEVREPELKEADNWEAYEYLSRERDLIAVFFFRCDTPQPSYTARLRGLEPDGTYRVDSLDLGEVGTRSGRELMEAGLRCALDAPRRADVFLLSRL